MKDETRLKQRRSTLVIESIVFLALGICLGFRALSDPDIGWHVATGLWMLDNGAVPYPDPFAAGGAVWIAYSWLPEVFYALAFRWQEFYGLQLLQLLTVLVSLAALLFLVECVASRLTDEQVGHHSLRMARALTYLLLIPTMTLVWNLRPQVLSLTCLAVFLGLRELREERLRFIIPLTILWLNLHIYWILLPLIVVIDMLCRPYAGELQGKRSWAEQVSRVMLILACVLANPYGLENLGVVFSYAFQHSESYRLILEFQPIYKQQGIIPLVAALWFVLSLPSLAEQYRKCGASNVVLFWGFALAALMQLKYVPAFGLIATPLVLRTLSRSVGRWSSDNCNLSLEQRFTRSQLLLIVIALVVFVGAFKVLAPDRNPLPSKQQELLALSERIVQDKANKRRRCVIFSDFNDSGWVILGTYLALRDSMASGERITECRVAIDGRTLVTGERRMMEYSELQQSPEAFSRIMKEWQVSDILLRRDTKLGRWAEEVMRAQPVESSENYRWLRATHAVE